MTDQLITLNRHFERLHEDQRELVLALVAVLVSANSRETTIATMRVSQSARERFEAELNRARARISAPVTYDDDVAAARADAAKPLNPSGNQRTQVARRKRATRRA